MIFLLKGDVQPVPVVVEAEALGHPNILLATKRNHRSKGGWIKVIEKKEVQGFYDYQPTISGMSSNIQIDFLQL